MKDEKKDKVEEKKTEQPSLVKQYFTEELQKRIAEMPYPLMEELLKELEGTKYWVAIIKYSQERLSTAQNALITLDPFKEPTLMARYQGVMSGVLDLQDGVIALIEESKKKEDPAAKKEEQLNDLGGAYGKF